ncbi:hypothetical protein ACFV2V_16895 [Streptomyces sp. NPDC059698]|nr:hypothetical protein [Streptomyces sp. CB02366]
MRRHLFRCCGNAPGGITSEDPAVINRFRSMFTALRNPCALDA